MNTKIGIVGGIVVLFTIALFALLDFYWLALHTWALVFNLLAQFAFFGGLIAISFVEHKHNQVFLRSGMTATLFLYLMATIIVSLLFASFFPIGVNHFVLIHLGIIAFFAAASLLILGFSKRVVAVDQKSHEAVGETKGKRGGF